MFSMSTMIPNGEANLIRLTKRIKYNVDDKELKKDIELLIKQELNHLRIHKRFNNHVYKQIPVKDFANQRNQFIKKYITDRYWGNNKNNFKSIA